VPIRGAKLATRDPMRRLFWRLRANAGDSLTLAGKPISRLDETKHFQMIGTTGRVNRRPSGSLPRRRWNGEIGP